MVALKLLIAREELITFNAGESDLITGVLRPLPVPPLAMPGSTGTPPGIEDFRLDGGTKAADSVAGITSLAIPL